MHEKLYSKQEKGSKRFFPINFNHMLISEAKSRVTNYHTSDWRQEILQEKCMISANSFLPKPCIRHHKMPTSTMQYQYIVQTLKNKKWNRDYQSNIQESTELFHSRKV